MDNKPPLKTLKDIQEDLDGCSRFLTEHFNEIFKEMFEKAECKFKFKSITDISIPSSVLRAEAIRHVKKIDSLSGKVKPKFLGHERSSLELLGMRDYIIWQNNLTEEDIGK